MRENRYDALGRRILRYAGWNGSSVQERYFYDGADVICDYDMKTGELRALYLTPFLDENLLKENFTGPGPVLAWYMQDGLGSVRQLVVGERVTNSYTYTAWGVPLNWHESISDRYTYTSRERDSESGLYYYRSRQYAPRAGAFLQRDLLSAGQRHRPGEYTYVDNNPVVYADSLGMLKHSTIITKGLAASGGKIGGVVYGKCEARVIIETMDFHVKDGCCIIDEIEFKLSQWIYVAKAGDELDMQVGWFFEKKKFRLKPLGEQMIKYHEIVHSSDNYYLAVMILKKAEKQMKGQVLGDQKYTRVTCAAKIKKLLEERINEWERARAEAADDWHDRLEWSRKFPISSPTKKLWFGMLDAGYQHALWFFGRFK